MLWSCHLNNYSISKCLYWQQKAGRGLTLAGWARVSNAAAWLPASLPLCGQRVLGQERYWDKLLGQRLSHAIEIREGRWFLAARGQCWGRGEAGVGSGSDPCTCSTSCGPEKTKHEVSEGHCAPDVLQITFNNVLSRTLEDAGNWAIGTQGKGHKWKTRARL